MRSRRCEVSGWADSVGLTEELRGAASWLPGLTAAIFGNFANSVTAMAFSGEVGKCLQTHSYVCLDAVISPIF